MPKSKSPTWSAWLRRLGGSYTGGRMKVRQTQGAWTCVASGLPSEAAATRAAEEARNAGVWAGYCFCEWTATLDGDVPSSRKRRYISRPLDAAHRATVISK
jgi:hypothetical protein